ncbi:hypothetical protein [Leptolyngbya sp. FACHB-711]|uniref:hypothetical protein n=1 Tax=Leptolyngbya sp. FACHB-711 TaxID=2692813 RepID=UPI001684B754|nr:hypothetical protein [Leptolyngbya sp. FACHB-711]MBD2028199.1 hypothetical protein [Leptolyngbya sp. FACHB-711]
MKMNWKAFGLAVWIGMTGIVSPANANGDGIDLSVVIKNNSTQVFTEIDSPTEALNGDFNPESIDLSSLPEDYVFPPGDYQSGVNLAKTDLDKLTGIHIFVDGQGQWTKRADNLYVRVLVKRNNPSLGIMQWHVTRQAQPTQMKDLKSYGTRSDPSLPSKFWQRRLDEAVIRLLEELHLGLEEYSTYSQMINANTSTWDGDIQVTKQKITSLQETSIIQPSSSVMKGNRATLKINNFWFLCKYQCKES